MGWDDNILGLIHGIHHPIWMLKLLNMTKFGDAGRKGEKCPHQRHWWPWASPRPEGQDACDLLLGLVCWMWWRAAQTCSPVIISSKIGAVWVQAAVPAAFWKRSSDWLMIIHSWLDGILLFNLKFRSLCIASLTSSKLTPGESRGGGIKVNISMGADVKRLPFIPSGGQGHWLAVNNFVSPGS